MRVGSLFCLVKQSMLKRSIFLMLPLLAGCGDPSVAEVGSRSILASEYKRQLRIYQSIRPGLPVDDNVKRQVLEQVIRQELLADDARALGLDRDPRFKAGVQERVGQLKQELNTAVENAQVQLQGLEKAVETKALIDALIQAKQGGLSVTAKELREAYALRQKTSGKGGPSFEQSRDSLTQQIILEKLVGEASKRVPVTVHVEAALAP